MPAMKLRRIARAAVPLAVIAAVTIGGAGVASAHVTAHSPDPLGPGSYVEIVFRAPNEQPTANFTKLEVDFSTTSPIPGVDVKPGGLQEFTISANGLPTNTNVLEMPAVQTYDKGVTVDWNQPALASGPEPERPAPSLSLVPPTLAAGWAASASWWPHSPSVSASARTPAHDRFAGPRSSRRAGWRTTSPCRKRKEPPGEAAAAVGHAGRRGHTRPGRASVRPRPVLREVFGEAARFADAPPGFARELRAALDGVDAAPGRALALRYTWAAAADRHRSFYRSLHGSTVTCLE